MVGEDALVSVIIPTYNSQLTIERCLMSISAQTYPFIEIIVVDDCSNDNTVEIVKKYEMTHRVLLIQQNQNSGAGSSRNMGLSVANGKYIAFIDSDDSVVPNFVERLLEGLDASVELSVCGIRIEEMDGIWKNNNLFAMDSIIDAKQYVDKFAKYKQVLYFGSPVNKLYRSSIIKKNHILFDNGVWEDLIFNMKYLTYVNCVKTSSDSSYHYYYTNGSISNSFIGSKTMWDRGEKAYRVYRELLEGRYGYNSSQKEVCGFLLNNIKTLVCEFETEKLSIKKRRVFLNSVLRNKEFESLRKCSDSLSLSDGIILFFIKQHMVLGLIAAGMIRQKISWYNMKYRKKRIS